jgi:microcystin-dependent protein
MTWPTVAVATTALDQGTDTPPRAEILKLAQNLNAIMAHVSTDAQSVLSAANLAAMRSVLVVYSKSEIDALLSAAVPVGFPAMWLSTVLPANFLVRDGSLLSRTTYATLFAVIGTTYGAGDGSTTFALPDDRGNVERGWDQGRGVDPGRVFGSEQLGQNASHTHGVNDPGHSHFVQGTGGGGGASGLQGNSSGGPLGGAYVSASLAGVSIQSQGGTEARMRNRAYLPIIKYQ